MPSYIRPAVLLLLSAALACNKGPEFTHEAFPGLERTASFAVDPRQLIFRVEGKRDLDPGPFRTAAIQELKAKGFRPAAPGAADLWVDVIVLSDQVDPDGPPQKGASEPDGGEGKGRGGRGKGGQGPGAGGGPARRAMSGDLIVMVKLISRADLKTVWHGRAFLPEGHTLPEPSIRTLLAPLPVRPPS